MMFSTSRLLWSGIAVYSFLLSTGASASTILFSGSVLGTAAIFSAGGNGSPSGSTAAQLALTFTAGSGETIQFSSVTGLVGCCGSANIGPDGQGGSSNISALNSISGFAAPSQLPLLGVFLDANAPSGAPPANFSYPNSAALTAATYSPLLNQVFFIGDGLTGTGSGSQQVFNVPVGATRLYLGFADAIGFSGAPAGYSDNPGSLSFAGSFNDAATPQVPEPSSFVMMCGATALIAIGAIRRKKNA